MKYVKKPIAIEAFKYGYEQPPDWFELACKDKVVQVPISGGGLVIDTLEGQMWADVGSYIIQGVQGEIYPCRGDIFEETYLKVED